MHVRRVALSAMAGFVLFLGVHASHEQDKSIVVSSTTSTQDSGLFGSILPMFKAKTGIDVRVVAQGTERTDLGHGLPQASAIAGGHGADQG